MHKRHVLLGLALLSFGCGSRPKDSSPSPSPHIARAEQAAPATKPGDVAGQAVYVNGEMLRDYTPQAELVTKATPVQKPKFPVIDVHCHWSLDQDPAKLLAAMDKLGERRAVNLSGGWGETLDKMLAKFHAVAPERLLVFCNIDYKRIDDATFGTDVVNYLDAARAKGVSGLKVFKDLGLYAKDKRRHADPHRRPAAGRGVGRVRDTEDAGADPLGRPAGVLQARR